MSSKWRETTLPGGIHGFTGGAGTAVILLSGWPETAEAYSEVFASLAQRHEVFALDLPGLGDSAPPADGYDTANVARLLADSMQTAAGSVHLVGHDVGAWVAYAWAAQYPEQLKSLTLLDASIPGTSTPPSFPLPAERNEKLWQFSFNMLPDLPEILTAGKERELLDWLFTHKAKQLSRIPQANREHYVSAYARPGAMSRGFAYYRAVAESAKQNKAFSQTKLSMPVLTLAGRSGTGEQLKKAVEPLALQVDGTVLEDCGHYLMEEQPGAVAAALIRFFEGAEGGL